MGEQHDYDGARIKALTPREAVLSRPDIYFGALPVSDWPLMIVAWAMFDLLDTAPPDCQQVWLTIRSDGAFEVSVGSAAICWPKNAETAAEALQRRHLWTHLCCDVTITIRRNGQTPGPDFVTVSEGGQRLLSAVDITVVASIDPDVVSAPSATWWRDWLDRLPEIVGRLGFRFTSEQSIVALDAATSTSLTFCGAQVVSR